MGIRRTEEFRSEAVRIALTSGLSQNQVADDLGIGLSTLSKWVAARKHDELMAGSHDDKDMELARLRKENRILREERDILKKATAFFASQSRGDSGLSKRRRPIFGSAGCAKSWVSAKAVIMPGRLDQQVSVNEMTWCIWPIFVPDISVIIAPMAASA